MSPAVLISSSGQPDPLAAPAWPASVWRADQLGEPVRRVWPSGFAALDAELPGGGWPGHGLTEVLGAHGGALEWRLLAPLLAQLCAQGRDTLLVGPPHAPHPSGLNQAGVAAGRLVWLQASTPTERLWSTEQLIKANAGAAVLAWLPQVRPEQLRRLQVLAAGCETPVFIFRAEAAAREPSAAPLRVRARVAPGWAIALDILKRKGPPLGQPLHLQAVPLGLAAVLPPRLREPVCAIAPPRMNTTAGENAHVVVRPVPAAQHALH